MPFPKIKLADDSGNEVGVTSNRLDVNAHLAATPTIDIGDVSLLLGGTAADTGLGVYGGQTLRVNLASNDVLTTLMVNDLDDISGDTTTIAGDTTEIAANFSQTGGPYAQRKGIAPIVVRNDELAAVPAGVADGDYTELQVDSIGGLYVTGSEVENAAVQSEPLLIGGRYDSSARTLGSGDAGAVALNASGHMIMDIVDGGQLDTVIDTLETTLTAIETDQAAIEVLLTAIDSDTDAIKTAVEILDDWDDSNYANVNLNIAGTDVDGNSGNKSAQSQRVVIATDDVNVSAIKTAVEIIDNAIDGSEMQVDIVSSATLSVNSHAVTNAGTFAVQSDATVHPAGNGTFNSYARFTAATSPTALTDSSNGVNDTETAAKEVIIQADYTNTGYLMVGDSGATATSNGIRLNAGDTLILPVADIADIYIDASGASQKVFVTVIK